MPNDRKNYTPKAYVHRGVIIIPSAMGQLQKKASIKWFTNCIISSLSFFPVFPNHMVDIYYIIFKFSCAAFLCHFNTIYHQKLSSNSILLLSDQSKWLHSMLHDNHCPGMILPEPRDKIEIVVIMSELLGVSANTLQTRYYQPISVPPFVCGTIPQYNPGCARMQVCKQIIKQYIHSIRKIFTSLG